MFDSIEKKASNFSVWWTFVSIIIISEWWYVSRTKRNCIFKIDGMARTTLRLIILSVVAFIQVFEEYIFSYPQFIWNLVLKISKFVVADPI